MNKVLKQKARLVTHSFTQHYNLDYKQIYTCIIKPVIYQTLLALAAFFNLEIEQVDFLSVYLHSDLDKKMYIKQSKKFKIDEIDNTDEINKEKCQLV